MDAQPSPFRERCRNWIRGRAPGCSLPPDKSIGDVTRDRISAVLPALAAGLATPVGVLAPNGMAVLLAVAGLLAVVLEPKLLRFAGVPPAAKFAVAALIAWIIAAVFWSPDLGEAASGAVRVVPAALLGLLFVGKILSLDEPACARLQKWMLAGFCCGAAILATHSLSVVLTHGYQNSLFAELFGPQAASPAFANRPKTVVALLLPLAVAIAWRRNGLAMAVLPVVLSAFPLIHGEAAAAGMSLAVAAVGAVFGWFGGRKSMRALGIGLAIGILLAPAIVRLPQFDDLAQRRDIHVSFFHRAGIWAFVAERIAEKPLFGWGFNASRNVPGGQAIIAGAAEKIPLHPHNAPLQIWLELGGIGAAIAAALISALAFACAGPRARQAALVATLLVGIFIASVSYGIWQGWWFATLWLATAFACAVGKDSVEHNAVRP